MSDNDKLAAMAKQIAALEAQNAALKAAATTAMSVKMTDKGGISVYGLGRFPVTLYPFGKDGEGEGQWARLFSAKDKVLAFITANTVELKRRAKANGEVQEALKAAPIVPSTVKPTKPSAL
jgi:hypothetical protein